ncbi:2-oxoacid:acceptor oxidoreductase family protein [Pyrobaculum neutrophilum]|uniref:pyruvate synthase n=1 Tax=Pyrobaculum neutrophilum (strain DSM 2338 / JCM 9278 / NBRC 100436 / V24Sta) TaxID=444157 RepID=B1YB15_PYRNV|nr:2-oxoacid:acceptor oxidoreductase family protein [Pyrobaculum neutrophilum]ACB40715.1 pyruvate/ketoisovalerate oxidoreductase, gamma subunit [Pyrobaculum neutrophilum V24Sta]
MRVETIWLGRGGQGIVTATYIVANAAVIDGFYAIANPEFGAERRGAPVKAFLTIDKNPIEDQEPIKTPDVAIIFDDKLIDPMRFAIDAVKPGGYVIVNSAKQPEEVRKLVGRNDVYVVVLDAVGIAMKHVGLPVPNGPLAGAFSKVMGFPRLESIKTAFENQLGKAVEENFAATKEAYEVAVVLKPEKVDASAKPKGVISTTSAFLTGPYELVGWQQVNKGGAVGPGSSLPYLTGGWRIEKPIIDHSKCIMCRKCWLYCPDDAIIEAWREAPGPRGRVFRTKAIDFDYQYCKGCGVCAEVCPTGAIQMVREI